MKRISLIAGVVILAGTSAYAVPTAGTTPGKIRNSKHDLNATKAGDSAKGEICIYCHTPHNSLITVPLWNRNNPSPGNFNLYNSSTLTPSARSSALSSTSISLFCMSCHDGVTGLGDVSNKNMINGSTIGNPMLQTSTGVKSDAGTIAFALPENPRLGTNLQNTHPVGFVFSSVPGADSGIRDGLTIMTTFNNLKRTAGIGYDAATDVQFFLYGPGENMFECASCHRVHDPGTSGNFLRIENDKSQLCLACHNK